MAGVADFFHFVPGYENYVFRAGREPLFFLLLAFLLTFLAVRTYTRLGRARAWGSGSVRGIHVHHSVPGIIALNMSFALIAFLKGKVKLGTFGIFVPGLAILAAARLAKPGSLWAHRFYRPEKLDRSRARSTLQHARYAYVGRLYDLIGGAPDLERHPHPHG